MKPSKEDRKRENDLSGVESSFRCWQQPVKKKGKEWGGLATAFMNANPTLGFDFRYFLSMETALSKVVH